MKEEKGGVRETDRFLPRTAQSTRLLPSMEPTMMKLKARVHIVLVISPSASLRVVSFTGERSALLLLFMKGEIQSTCTVTLQYIYFVQLTLT